jgi:hypothetical protein
MDCYQKARDIVGLLAASTLSRLRSYSGVLLKTDKED